MLPAELNRGCQVARAQPSVGHKLQFEACARNQLLTQMWTGTAPAIAVLFSEKPVCTSGYWKVVLTIGTLATALPSIL